MDLKAPGNGKLCPTPREIVNGISELSRSDGNLGRIGTFSAAIYDTAWLSMVYKRDRGKTSYLFTKCFNYLLETQKEDGTWTTYGSQIDGILNTLAALLSMAKRRKCISSDFKEETTLHHRIQMAQSGVQSLLQSWDVNETVHVGFEVLVTGLLRQLRLLNLHFEFPGYGKLMLLYERKMQKFSPDLIYSNKKTTILHSLEALTGMIEFDRVGHHCSEELGIFGSPAATAAYLINASKWDQRAATYLESVVTSYGNSGSVPSAFPTSIFEISWALSSLLSQAISLNDLEPVAISKITSFLMETMEKQHGLVGFTPGVLEDADDTARTLMTLKLLGQDVNPAPMIKKFEASDHFRTYEMERDPSFSANCNVLLALLELESVDQYLPQIEKTLTFLLQKWDSGEVVDKWNISPQYSAMLMAEAFVRLLKRYDAGNLQSLPLRMVQEQIPVSLCRLLLRTLGGQQNDGSWTTSLEDTSYSILIITQCLCLPWNTSLRDCLVGALSRGRGFIASQYPKDKKNHCLWIEKTTFESSFLKMAYCSIALHTTTLKHFWTQNITDSFFFPDINSKKMRSLLSALPIFVKSPLASLDLVLIEATYFSNCLKEARYSILQRDDMSMSKDKYLDYIPIIWLACNHIGGHILSSNIIRDMALLSLFNYQIDEFMESVVADLADAKIQVLVLALRNECGLNKDSSLLEEARSAQLDTEQPRKRRKVQNGITHASTNPTPESVFLESVIKVLRKFIRHVLQHPAVLRSPGWVQRELAIEVHNFLIAHINHNEDNISWLKAKQNQCNGYTSDDISRGNYFKWVHSTGSDDTSCPFSFQFFTCLISKPGETHFNGPQARYFSQSLATHLAIMCRQYNDHGSAARDAVENNLNSLDFAEFHQCSTEEMVKNKIQMDDEEPIVNENSRLSGAVSHDHLNTIPAGKAKEDLMAIAEFERESMHLALQSLSQFVQPLATMKALKVFIDVTDTFGQIYIQKDIASRKQTQD